MRWGRPVRPLILIALLLLVGAVVNVGVAWGIAAFGPQPQVRVMLSGARGVVLGSGARIEGADSMIVSVDGRAGEARQARWHAAMAPPRGLNSTARAGWGFWQCWEADFQRSRAKVTSAVGWPLPALRSSTGLTSFPAPAPPRSGLFLRTGGRPPVAVLLPGFLVNTLLYTAILAVPLSFFPIRRRLRARRGRCAKCGYDRAGLADSAAPCPECGAAR